VCEFICLKQSIKQKVQKKGGRQKKIPNSKFQKSNSKFQVPKIKFQIPSSKNQISNFNIKKTRNQESKIKYQDK